MAMAVAHAHNCEIVCESVAGVGTTFSVYLPLASEASRFARATEPASHGMPRGNGELVMLVDDDAPLRALAQELLTDLGYRAVVFESSVRALDAFREDPDAWDLILSDEVMPDLTGTQLAACIHQMRAGTPIIIITAYGGPGFQLRAEEAGVAKVMKKPYQPNDVALALAELLALRRVTLAADAAVGGAPLHAASTAAAQQEKS
jgi:CheY-like chemotaxis protein